MKQGDERYQRFLLLLRELKPFIDEWVSFDSGIGKASSTKGKSFESKCSNEGVELILRRLQLKREEVRVCLNVSWDGTPGEIDIVILDASSDKVLSLAECKCRLFDIA